MSREAGRINIFFVRLKVTSLDNDQYYLYTDFFFASSQERAEELAVKGRDDVEIEDIWCAPESRPAISYDPSGPFLMDGNLAPGAW